MHVNVYDCMTCTYVCLCIHCMHYSVCAYVCIADVWACVNVHMWMFTCMCVACGSNPFNLPLHCMIFDSVKLNKSDQYRNSRVSSPQ